jgi:hypothetical protein
LLSRTRRGRVSVQKTMLDGVTDHLVVGASYPWLMRHPLVGSVNNPAIACRVGRRLIGFRHQRASQEPRSCVRRAVVKRRRPADVTSRSVI